MRTDCKGLLPEFLHAAERWYLLNALERNGWSVVKTAVELSINRTSLYKRLQHLGISPKHGKRGSRTPTMTTSRALAAFLGASVKRG